MKLTKRGNTLAGIALAISTLGVMGIAGAIETQDIPTCSDYQLNQDWQSAWENSCPFTDNNGNYLYTWEAN
jgi:hypothetical protein